MQLIVPRVAVDLFGSLTLPPVICGALGLSPESCLSLQFNQQENTLLLHPVHPKDIPRVLFSAHPDEEGRLTIPIPLILLMNLHPDEQCVCYLQENSIVIRKSKYKRRSREAQDGFVRFQKHDMCQKCIYDIRFHSATIL